MPALFYYGFFYGLMLIVLGLILSARRKQKIYMIAGILFGAVEIVGTVMFLVMNVGENVALHRFNFLGLDIAFYSALLVAFVSIILWLSQKRKFYPGLLLLILSLLQIVCYLLLRFYYSR